MSTGQVGSRFGDVSNSTDRSCRSAVTRLISDQFGYSALVTRPIFRSVGLQRRSDPITLKSDLNIIKPDSTDLSSIRHCNIQMLQIGFNIMIYILPDAMRIFITAQSMINFHYITSDCHNSPIRPNRYAGI